MKYPTFFGIDLTSTEAKPSACLGLDDKSQLVYFGFIIENGDIVTLLDFYSPQVIAVDAPLCLPSGHVTLRNVVLTSPNPQGRIGNVTRN